MNLPCYIGFLVDVNGNYYHNYREDSYICDEELICPTIKETYSINSSFWVIVRREDDIAAENR